MRLALRLNGIFYDRLSLRNGGLAQAADIFRFGLGRLKSSRISMPVFRRRRLVDSIPRLDLNRLSEDRRFALLCLNILDGDVRAGSAWACVGFRFPGPVFFFPCANFFSRLPACRTADRAESWVRSTSVSCRCPPSAASRSWSFSFSVPVRRPRRRTSFGAARIFSSALFKTDGFSLIFAMSYHFCFAFFAALW